MSKKERMNVCKIMQFLLPKKKIFHNSNHHRESRDLSF